MSGYHWNPTVTEMRQAYEVAYGDYGMNVLIGALFANVTDMKINELYQEAIDKVRNDLDKAGLL